jgi:hypothetical protein
MLVKVPVVQLVIPSGASVEQLEFERKFDVESERLPIEPE